MEQIRDLAAYEEDKRGVHLRESEEKLLEELAVNNDNNSSDDDNYDDKEECNIMLNRGKNPKDFNERVEYRKKFRNKIKSPNIENENRCKSNYRNPSRLNETGFNKRSYSIIVEDDYMEDVDIKNDNMDHGNNESVNMANENVKTYVANKSNICRFCSILALPAFPLAWDIATIAPLIKYSSFENIYGTLRPKTTGTLSPETYGTLSPETYGTLSPETTRALSPEETGHIVSIFQIGALIGCILCSVTGKFKINLKILIVISLMVYLFGTIIQLLSSFIVGNIWIFNNLWVFTAGRFLCGISGGVNCVISPIYTNELIVLDKYRKSFLGYFQILICSFILIGGIINIICSEFNFSFLAIIGLQIVYVIIGCGSLYFIPSSLSYLLSKGETEELNKIYEKLYLEFNNDYLFTKKQINDYTNESNKNLLKGFFKKLRSAFKIPYTKQAIKCYFLMGLQQLTGINFFFYYGDSLLGRYSSIILGLFNLAGTISSCIIIKRFKLSLKRTLAYSSLAMGLLMFLYAILGKYLSEGSKIRTFILGTIACIFVLLFAFSWGPCCGILSNIISNNKSEIIGFSIAINWAVNCAITRFSPQITKKIGSDYGFAFSACLFLIMYPFTKFCL